MRVPRRLPLVALLALAVAGCTGAPPVDRTVAEADAGSTVPLKVGEVLRVELPIQAGTGYVWSVAHQPAFLDDLGMGSRLPADGNAAFPGRPVLQLATFQVDAPGTGMLRLDYGREWEIGVPPEKSYQVQVVATP